ncbi:hypothetical protein CL628_00125 [bacterium]|nr:hypothetical protein [bacterium]
MLILPLIFLLAAASVGIGGILALRLTKEVVTTVALGITGGLAGATFILYLLSPLLPLSTAVVVIATIALIAGGYILLSRYHGWQQLRKLTLNKNALTWAILLFILFSFIAPKLLATTTGGLSTGIINNYGDIAWHTELVTSFAAGQSTPPSNPIYFGQRLAYPFLTDFASAILLTGGATIVESIVLLAMFLLPTLFVLFYLLTEKITRSSQAATIAVLLFLFSGSTFGWLELANDIAAAGGLPELLTGPWRFYYSGAADAGSTYHLINPLLGLILPQRSLLFGMPLVLSIIWLLTTGDKTVDPPTPRQGAGYWRGRSNPGRFVGTEAASAASSGDVSISRRKRRDIAAPNKKSKAPYLVAGSLAGMLPLFHAHSVLVLVPLILGLVWLRRSYLWLYFFGPALLLGLPQVAYYLTAPSQGAALTLQPGWMRPTGTNFLLYWLRNTGLLIPVALAGLLMKSRKHLQLLTTVGLLLFVAANIWLIAQWEWDNTKIFLYWLLFTLPIIGWATVEAMKRTPQWVNILIVFVLVIHGVSGFIDLTYLMLKPQSYVVWDANAVRFAQQVKDVTTNRALIVTAPVHNSSIELTGRPRYLGYAGHVWSHGINGYTREQALANLYEGRADNLPEGVARYIVVSPAERAIYPNLVIKPTWQLVSEQGPYQLYRLQ